jgi:methanogenic corrinoid protein MtbC1
MDRLAAQRVLATVPEHGPFSAVDTLVVPTLEKIGRDWETGRVALSQVYMSGRICEELLDSLLPAGSEDGTEQRPKVAITLLQDYHLLGKRIVRSMLRAHGVTIRDFGRTDVDELVARVREERIEILLISTLMLASALRVEDVVGGLKTGDSAVKVAVGGAPFRFDEQLWREVGADACGRTASDALRIVDEWSRRGR